MTRRPRSYVVLLLNLALLLATIGLYLDIVRVVDFATASAQSTLRIAATICEAPRPLYEASR